MKKLVFIITGIIVAAILLSVPATLFLAISAFIEGKITAGIGLLILFFFVYGFVSYTMRT